MLFTASRGRGAPLPFGVAFTFVVLMGLGGACESPPSYALRPLPAIDWSDAPLPSYGSLGRDLEVARRQGLNALKQTLSVPAAIETGLLTEDRLIWEEVLAALLVYNQTSASAQLAATLPWPSTIGCDVAPLPPPTPLPLTWQVEAQRVIQQHRAIFWRLGMLEIDARTLAQALRKIQKTFNEERSREEVSKALLAPLSAISAQLEHHIPARARLDASWGKMLLRDRFARHRPLFLFIDRLDEAFGYWQQHIAKDPRWGHLERSAVPILEQTQRWQRDFKRLVETVSTGARQIKYLQRLTQHLPLSAPPRLNCISVHVDVSARSLFVLDHLLRMQYQLITARRGIRTVRVRLERGHSNARKKWIAQGITTLQALETELSERIEGLMALESETLARWDLSSEVLWTQLFSDVANALEQPTAPNVGTAGEWRQRFFKTARPMFPHTSPNTPEPVQPRFRRRKQSPLISYIMELARAPAIVAQIEQGLLAISALAAHLRRVHGLIVQECGENCSGLPSAEVPFSPREGTQVRVWQKRPLEERTLGHNLIVLELTRLHLARQTQQLERLYAWIAEGSNIDNTWPHLEDWDGTWDLYVRAGGSYLKFLRKFSELLVECKDVTAPPEHRPHSKQLGDLMLFQWELVALTIDHARFIDRGREPPTSSQADADLHPLLKEWVRLQETLRSIENATLKRDERAAEKSK